jgi:thiamine pyrophosphokinase
MESRRQWRIDCVKQTGTLSQIAMIVLSPGPIIVVGAGDVSAEDLETVRESGHPVVAADGGARRCLEAGVMPAAVIGDLDSFDGSGIPAERIHRIAEQETTDFDKCLRSVTAPLVLAYGVSGPRLDHTLAVFTAIVQHSERRVVVVGAADLVFHVPPRLALDLAPGTRLSLFPMAPVTGRSEGLRWPIAGLDFAPAGRIGTSNEATGPVRLWFDGPGMLVITPRAALAQVSAALTAEGPPG